MLSILYNINRKLIQRSDQIRLHYITVKGTGTVYMNS